MSCEVSEVTESSFSNLSVTSPTSQLILQRFHRFTYVTAHSLTLPLLHLRHRSFSNPSFDSPTSQALHLRHLASCPWCKKRMRYERPSKWHLRAELILQPFRHFTCITAHSPTLSSLYLRRSSFCKPSVASPTSQFILQPFFRFSYVTGSSFTSPGEPPMILNTSSHTLSEKSNLFCKV